VPALANVRLQYQKKEKKRECDRWGEYGVSRNSRLNFFSFVPCIAVIPAVVQVMTLQPDLFSLQQSQHLLLSCFHLLKKMSPVKVLGSKFRTFQYALQVKFYRTALSFQVLLRSEID
jgi:hypothetical protein